METNTRNDGYEKEVETRELNYASFTTISGDDEVETRGGEGGEEPEGTFLHESPSAMYVLPRVTEKRKIVCSVVLTSVAFMLYYTATVGASVLQSTVNAKQGLGVLSLATSHISGVCCKPFAAHVPGCLGPKRTMTVAYLTAVPYLVAQLYPTFLTLIPAAVLHGLGSELLSTSVYLYLFSEAWIYSQLSEVPIKVAVGNFFILFFVISTWSLIWSGAVPYAVLSLKENVTSPEDRLPKDLCGADFCSEYLELVPNLKRPSGEAIKVIMLMFTGCPVVAFVISLTCIKSLEKYQDEGLLGRPQKHKVASLLNLCEHAFLLPLMLCFGMMRAFVIADLTQSFIACNYGTTMIAITTIAAGMSKLAAASVVYLVAKLDKHLLFALLIVANLSLFVCLAEAKPVAESVAATLGVVIAWNVVDSVWIILFNKILPHTFTAVDANLYMQTWQHVGSALMYCLSFYVCTRRKLHLILGSMAVSTFGYVTHAIFIHFRTESTREERAAVRSVLPFQ